MKLQPDISISQLELVKLLVILFSLIIMPTRMEFVCCREIVQVENEYPCIK